MSYRINIPFLKCCGFSFLPLQSTLNEVAAKLKVSQKTAQKSITAISINKKGSKIQKTLAEYTSFGKHLLRKKAHKLVVNYHRINSVVSFA